ncbi:MAG: GspE/PulE family protein [Oligoflexales bacterium]
MSRVENFLMSSFGLSSEDAQDIVQTAQSKNEPLLRVVEKTYDHLSEQQLLESFASFYNCKWVNLAEKDIPMGVVKLIPGDAAETYRVVPIDRAGQNIMVAMADPLNLEVIKMIRWKTSGYMIRPILALPSHLDQAIQKCYGALKMDVGEGAPSSRKRVDKRSDLANGTGNGGDDGPVIRFVNNMLTRCVEVKASDIHLETYENTMRVRLRIDGTLTEAFRQDPGMSPALVSRIKIMSGLDIAETRLPQDGAIQATVRGKEVEFRVSTLPTSYGEKIVMRLLDRTNLQVDMTQLGMEDFQLDVFRKAIYMPQGMVLVTGPTGSGKTTTLYSALSDLNKEQSNIMTAEDPVEYYLSGINQVKIRADIDLTFAAALRSFLRQDPDIIMVGEIRDQETAEIAIKAALTGHLVLSTLHTNSAIETITRLLDMGVERFNLAGALRSVTAQRLLRRICTKCREIDEDVTSEILKDIGVPEQYLGKIHAYKGKGCYSCGNTGLKGRIAVHEILDVNDQLKLIISGGQSTRDVRNAAVKTGFSTLRMSAIRKMAQGVVPLSEVTRMTSPDE